MALINQKDNYKANFGISFRSSSIFWIAPLKTAKTTIIVFDYWKIKNNLEVTLVLSYRNIKGKLVKREIFAFNEKTTLRFTPIKKEFDKGGSLEIEAISNKELKIPYSAIMVVYETKNSLSMVHSYSRLYSSYEIEEGRTISEGHEGCWTIKSNKKIKNFAVAHNGNQYIDSQKAKLTIKNFLNQKIEKTFLIRKLKPFETYVIKPNQIIKNLHTFLKGMDGSACIDFKLKNSFTRLLIGWEDVTNEDLQVTHSNFNYKIHKTDSINKSESNIALLRTPNIPLDSEVIIYPDMSPGSYILKIDDNPKAIRIKKVRELYKGNKMEFSKKNGSLPSRIITGIKSINKKNLPFECSLGVVHKERPKKRFHWGIFHSSMNSFLVITSYPEIYGENIESKIIISLFSDKGEISRSEIFWKEIVKNDVATININDLLVDNKKNNLPKNYYYLTAFSEYGGFFMYTLINKNNSWTLEHTF